MTVEAPHRMTYKTNPIAAGFSLPAAVISCTPKSTKGFCSESEPYRSHQQRIWVMNRPDISSKRTFDFVGLCPPELRLCTVHNLQQEDVRFLDPFTDVAVVSSCRSLRPQFAFVKR